MVDGMSVVGIFELYPPVLQTTILVIVCGPTAMVFIEVFDKVTGRLFR